MQTIFEKSQSRQHAYSLPASDSAFNAFHPPQHLLRQTPLLLPEISELDLTRHFSQLAHRNMSIDTNFYPLGSCTMKLYVELPQVGKKVSKGGEAAVLESTKAAADVYSPVSGTILEVNDELSTEAQKVNESPEKGGWLFKVQLDSPEEISTLMTWEDYQKSFG